MSQYIKENTMNPSEAMDKGLQAGASEINIVSANGVIEVKHSDGSLLMQAKNVREGTMTKIWDVLESCGDIDFRG